MSCMSVLDSRKQRVTPVGEDPLWKVHTVSREKTYLSHVYVIFENGLLLSLALYA